jgi:hypothetical protein
MGSIITNNSMKNKYANQENISGYEEKMEEQRVEYSIKYSPEVLAIDDPDFIHTDIMFDIYKKSVQIRVDKIRNKNQCIYELDDDLSYIGREIYDNQNKKDIDLCNLIRSDFVFGQKLIYTEMYLSNIKTKFELYMLYFIDKIFFFIFVLSERDYRLYFKEYLFERKSSLISKKDIECVISLSFRKYYMYCNEFNPKVLKEVKEEYYLYSIKRFIYNKFKVIDLLDIGGLYVLKQSGCHIDGFLNSNILLNNPIIEFHFLIEKQTQKIIKI